MGTSGFGVLVTAFFVLLRILVGWPNLAIRFSAISAFEPLYRL